MTIQKLSGMVLNLSKIVSRIPKNTGPQGSKQTRAELLVTEDISPEVRPVHPPTAHTHLSPLHLPGDHTDGWEHRADCHEPSDMKP